MISTVSLHRLQVEAVYLLTDYFLRLLLRYTQGVRSLNMRMCHCLGADALLAFAAEARSLRSLHLSGIMEDEQTAALVRRLRVVRPECKLQS